MKKLVLSEIPFYENLLVFDDVTYGMINRGMWFSLEDDSKIESVCEDIYTYDIREYEWCSKFSSAFQWVREHEEEIQQAFAEELSTVHGDVDELFFELNDYVDKIDDIKRRIKEYFSAGEV